MISHRSFLTCSATALLTLCVTNVMAPRPSAAAGAPLTTTPYRLATGTVDGSNGAPLGFVAEGNWSSVRQGTGYYLVDFPGVLLTGNLFPSPIVSVFDPGFLGGEATASVVGLGGSSTRSWFIVQTYINGMPADVTFSFLFLQPTAGDR